MIKNHVTIMMPVTRHSLADRMSRYDADSVTPPDSPEGSHGTVTRATTVPAGPGHWHGTVTARACQWHGGRAPGRAGPPAGGRGSLESESSSSPDSEPSASESLRTRSLTQ